MFGVFSAGKQCDIVSFLLMWLQVVEPEPPMVLFSRSAPPFHVPPKPSFAGDVLHTQPHNTVSGPPQEQP